MSEWYEKSFGEDYLIVYKHRDYSGAYKEVKSMIDWLSLPEGAKVLDLCCGMGRHSLALTEFGYDVTGVDLSEVLLNSARKADPAHSVNWIQSDMRQVPLYEPFDAVVNLFTSFGYFSLDDQNQKVIYEIERLLKPSGRFIIDFLNPGYVGRTLVPHSTRMDEVDRIHEYRRIEDGFVIKDIVMQAVDKEEKRQYRERIKLYEKEDFERLMTGTSLTIDQVYGGYDGSTFRKDESERLIIIGSRKELKAEDE